MPAIERVILRNFKRFQSLDLPLDPGRTLLVGDNEAGKSSILMAIDLALSASRSRVEAVGLENLFNRDAVMEFLAGARSLADLPELEVEIYLTPPGDDPDMNGKGNSKDIECDGIVMACRPSSQFSKAIATILQSNASNFPFEFYEISFTTFAEKGYSAFGRPVRQLLIDSSRIDSDYASREYIRSVYEINAEPATRNLLENEYRASKHAFGEKHLKDLNSKLEACQFTVKSSTKANLGSDLTLTEEGVALDSRGKGRQCFIKTEFALNKGAAKKGIDIVLLEEPENHLSHGNMKRLIERIAQAKQSQLIISTHSSLISSRLDLRKMVLLGSAPSTAPATLEKLDANTADFFMKAPDHSILEFILSKRVMLVEGDAEYVLMDRLYRNAAEDTTLEEDQVHVISVGGTSFKRYMELAKLLKIRTAVIRDNDKNYQVTCVDRYAAYVGDQIQVFADKDNTRHTFEICMYQDNQALCEELFASDRRTLSVQDYMLSDKSEAAFQLLSKKGEAIKVPAYIEEAVKWIGG